LLQPGRHIVLLEELLPLAVPRAGGIAWESLFSFDGGRPPWVSGLTQGTAIQAYSRAAARLRSGPYFETARAALGIFRTPPPEGVRVPAGAGVHYAQYSFEPRLRILNGFVQSLVGLYDYGRLAADPLAQALFAEGERRAREEVPTYDTGAWSLYSRGSVQRESDLGYHKLLRDFLSSLCTRTGEPTYCDAVARFTAYLSQPPVLDVRTTELRGGRYGRINLDLSKISLVTLRIERDGKLVHTRYVGSLAHGRRSLGWAVPRRAGVYTVELTARDLAGNPGFAEAPIDVLPPPKKEPKAR
jgi:hypothetical protein